MLRIGDQFVCRCVVVVIVSAAVLLSVQTAAAEFEQGDGYFSLYVLGSSPADRNLRIGSEDIPNTSLGSAVGAGLKVAYFPAFTRRFLGLEADYFGYSGDIVAPHTTVGGVPRFANVSLTTMNGMVNLIARYPGEIVQPYVGVGGGTSLGFLTSINFQSSAGTFSGDAFKAAWAYQFIGGLRINATQRFFLFGEYKFVGTRFKWDSEGPSGSRPQVSLDYRAQLILGGIGIRF